MIPLEIDVRLDHGRVRIKKSTGGTDRRVATAMREMVRLLWAQPQHRHLVLDIQNNRRYLRDVYDAYKSGLLADLSPSFEDRKLKPLVEEWLKELSVSDGHRKHLTQLFARLEGLSRHAVHLSELPALLEEYRGVCLTNGTPRQFNYSKAGALALLRDKMGRRHPLWLTVADIAGMPERKQGVPPLTVEQAKAVRKQLPENLAAIWWAMCCTGMGPTEFWGEWHVLADRIKIVGTKRPGRRWGSAGRDVPLVVVPARPTVGRDYFAKQLRKAGAAPYSGRKSYATWLEDAEIPRTRRRMYLGHGVKDVTDLYERREVTAFLAEDRDRLLKTLGPEATLMLSQTRGIVIGSIAQQAG